MLNVTCANCGKIFEAERSSAKFCLPACRTAYNRKKIGTKSEIEDADKELGRRFRELFETKGSEPEKVLAHIDQKYLNSKYVEPVVAIVDIVDIRAQIEAILAEKIPKERDTFFGRRAWAKEQKQRIESLRNSIK